MGEGTQQVTGKEQCLCLEAAACPQALAPVLQDVPGPVVSRSGPQFTHQWNGATKPALPPCRVLVRLRREKSSERTWWL